MADGYMGRIGFVDLSTGEIREEKIEAKKTGYLSRIGV